MYRIITLLLIFTVVVTNARQISQQEAWQVATEFFNKENVTKHCRTLHQAKKASSESEVQPYYVFNAPDNAGFVIVSGDDRACKILGYSDVGSFNFNNMPPQLSEILDRFSRKLNQLPTDQAQDPSWKAPQTRSNDGVLLKTANWGQGAPYNLDCPENCVTGCVTTAMAIIMKYYGWPHRGRGANINHDDPTRGEYSFDTEYDWDNALMDYSLYYETPEIYTDAQIDAVSKIMHDCATAIEAHFLPGGMTAADEHDCAYALRTFFYYDGNIGYCSPYEIDVNGDVALSYIKSELDQGRLLLMSGNSPQIGHAWVVDGYDSNGMLHINWGWDGGANGYFSYPIVGDYNASHIVYNVRPTEQWVEYSPWEILPSGNLNLDVVDVKRNTYFNAYCYHVTSSNNFHYPSMESVCIGTLAVALVDAEGNVKEILREMPINDWFNDRLKGSQYFTGLRVTVPMQDDDRIALLSKPTGYSDWLPFSTPPFVYTSRPVKGNEPKVADVRMNFIGERCGYKGYSCNTKNSYFQEKPMASGSYKIELELPKGKDKMWYAVKEQYPIGAIYARNPYWSPSVHIDLPYEIGSMTYNVQVFAFNDEDLMHDWTTVHLSTPGTLSSLLGEDERIRTCKLRVTGKMNTSDFDYIKNQMPLVKHLDIGDVSIVADKYNNFNDDYMPDFALERKRLDSIILPPNLKGIGLEALRENSFGEINLPASLEYIGLGAFWEGGDIDLMKVVCNNPVPPVIQAGQFGNEEHMFESTTYQRAVLWVPTGSKNDYLSQPYVWHNFVNVKEFTPAGVHDIQSVADGFIELFNLQGIKVYSGQASSIGSLPTGVYLYKEGDKTGKLILP